MLDICHPCPGYSSMVLTSFSKYSIKHAQRHLTLLACVTPGALFMPCCGNREAVPLMQGAWAPPRNCLHQLHVLTLSTTCMQPVIVQICKRSPFSSCADTGWAPSQQPWKSGCPRTTPTAAGEGQNPTRTTPFGAPGCPAKKPSKCPTTPQPRHTGPAAAATQAVQAAQPPG